MGNKINYMVGEQLGELTLIEEVDNIGGPRFGIFECKCGNTFKTSFKDAKSKHTTSCGCNRIGINITHGDASSTSPFNYLYQNFKRINARCYNPNNPDNKYYSKKGVINYWKKDYIGFKNYILSALGPRPTSKHSIDRYPNIDTIDYAPNNIRWATPKEQSQNRDIAVSKKDYLAIKIDLDSGKYLQKDICKKYGFEATTIRKIKQGKWIENYGNKI